MRDERFHFSDHSIDQGWNFYFVKAKLLLERDMTQALGFAIREAAFHRGPLEHLRKALRPQHFYVVSTFINEYGLTLDEVIGAFRLSSRVDGPKAMS
ncbi:MULTISPECIES: hypothetical protein [Pseudomonas]|uniref:Uncharacterized protein n=1 Tax=Pseudomonas quercus TaxID=2722792 RepID=A0ABX0YIQ0_9PSED|nr:MULTISPECIES: hypothetical protein [Pseudomonas]MBF7143870.1 hypothetical protein [Pseudomonas sp. LY10J]NJP02051.1 hypothetical protein [Pseudomonas quercus]